MNIAEYIEQNWDGKGYTCRVFFSDFAKQSGLKDIRTARECILSDLQELYKCKYLKNNQTGTLQSCIISEFHFSNARVVIDFSHWIHEIRDDSQQWLSEILQQTRLDNYIVTEKGDYIWLPSNK